MRTATILLAWIATIPPLALAAEDDLAAARRLLLTGKYAEAAEVFGRSAGKSPAAAVGLARALVARGRWEEAVKALEPATRHAEVQAELAWLSLRRGNYPAARGHVEAALRLDPENLLARWVSGELLRTAGKLDEAGKAYRWLVDYYNKNDVRQAESLRWIGLAAAQYARWNRLNDQFGFLVNELYPDALKAEAEFWPACFESGLLYLEKFNQAEASRLFRRALELNPHAAEVHAAMARLAFEHRDVREAQLALARALELNPRLPEALLMKAELAWANFQPEQAAEILGKEAIGVNPAWEEALGRLAACHLLRDPESPKDPASPFSRLVKEATDRNAHAGEFFVALASWLDDRHRGAEAERFLEEAARRMPQLVGPTWQLGVLALRAGDEPKAGKLLKEAFRADPFNLRVTNSLQVLEVLEGYETLDCGEVLLRFDPKRDKLLARYAARYLQKVYPELCRQFGHRPARKPLVEIFNEARGVRGSEWLATRMMGLPYVGPIAASTGHIVAMTSPNDGGHPGAFSWTRALRHELVHVITLQQTRFNMPHWCAEGLAVRAEGQARPQHWNALLIQRVGQGKLFDLDSINFIFTRPHSSEDWQMAYCQSALYVDYLVERQGDGAVGKLLSAYAENRATPEAVRAVVGISEGEFERGYTDYLKKVVSAFPAVRSPPREDIAELLKLRRARPKDMGVAAELALAYLQRGANKEARQLADEVRKVHPAHPVASYVLGRLLVREGRTAEAIGLLEECQRVEKPDLGVINLLAGLKLKSGRHAEAAELYALGARLEPYDLGWVRSLARVYLMTKDEARLPDLLARLARADPDDLATRKKLAQLSLARKDYAAAADWANQALEIDVQDAEVHATFAEALTASHNYPQAIEEFQTAIELDPEKPRPRLGLAEAYLYLGDRNKSSEVLEGLLKLDPKYPGAESLGERIQRAHNTPDKKPDAKGDNKPGTKADNTKDPK